MHRNAHAGWLLPATLCLLAGCGGSEAGAADAGVAAVEAPAAIDGATAANAGDTTVAGATAEASTPATDAGPDATAAAADDVAGDTDAGAGTGFDPASVPLTTATLPPFPFFDTPPGLASTYQDAQRTLPFDAQWFLAGTTPVLVEGKVFRDRFSFAHAGRPWTALEFHRNYENAIAALGGRKISTGQYTYPAVAAAGGQKAMEPHQHGASPVPDYRHESYLVRTPEHEYWIDVSTTLAPGHGHVVVVEKQAMAQSVGFLDAGAMKRAIDADGRVALQVNFDTDKATLRPDAQPVIDEIAKLLASDPALSLSIEGHTDATGDAAHNRRLSTARARSVLGALVGQGVDPARLASSGHGPDRPVADNATEDGRAKNRRVELVKR